MRTCVPRAPLTTELHSRPLARRNEQATATSSKTAAPIWHPAKKAAASRGGIILIRPIILVTFAAALVAAACGGGDGNRTDGGRAGGGGLQVIGSGSFFDPESLTAPAGDIEVTLNNEDSVGHTFTIEDLDVDLVVAGGHSDSASFSAKPGNYSYICRFHTQMTGELTVE